MDHRLKKKPFRHLRNQRGLLTVDFLVAMVLAFGLIVLTFAFATTLTVIEIGQYIAFATARAHAPGHLTQEKQIQLARQKFESYLDPKTFPNLAPILRNGWFEVDAKTLDIRGGGKSSTGADATFNEDYGYTQDMLPQIGIRYRLQANILKLNIPFAGNIRQDDDFGTFITGLLLREPTSEECRQQMQADQRFRAILDLDQRFRRIDPANPVVDNAYFAMEDNGC